MSEPSEPKSTGSKDTGKSTYKAESSLLRGALKLEASTSTPIVSAGSEFSIYVVIRNPFSVPVTIFTTETHIPIELSDEIWRKNQRKHSQQKQVSALAQTISFYQRLLKRIEYVYLNLLDKLFSDSGPRVAVAVSTEVQDALSRPNPNIYVGGNVETQGDFIGGSRWDLNFGELSKEEVHRILFEINEFMLGRSPVVLNVGDSVVKHFILKTTRWLMFTPISYTFQIQVRYEIENEIHVDTVPFSLSIRAAIGSSLIGSILGSVLGTIVNSNTDFNNWMTIGRGLLISTIFAVIVVVAFARKSNVQQIVSVEDFWGGVFIGFLVGYSGNTFINSVIGGSS